MACLFQFAHITNVSAPFAGPDGRSRITVTQHTADGEDKKNDLVVQMLCRVDDLDTYKNIVDAAIMVHVNGTTDLTRFEIQSRLYEVKFYSKSNVLVLSEVDSNNTVFICFDHGLYGYEDASAIISEVDEYMPYVCDYTNRFIMENAYRMMHSAEWGFNYSASLGNYDDRFNLYDGEDCLYTYEVSPRGFKQACCHYPRVIHAFIKGLTVVRNDDKLTSTLDAIGRNVELLNDITGKKNIVSRDHGVVWISLANKRGTKQMLYSEGDKLSVLYNTTVAEVDILRRASDDKLHSTKKGDTLVKLNDYIRDNIPNASVVDAAADIIRLLNATVDVDLWTKLSEVLCDLGYK